MAADPPSGRGPTPRPATGGRAPPQAPPFSATSGLESVDHLQPVIDNFAHSSSATELVAAERLVHDFANVFAAPSLI